MKDPIRIQVVWKEGFVAAMYAPWHNFTPDSSMIVTAMEVGSMEQAIRFMERTNCRAYRKVFPDAPCACGACEDAQDRRVYGYEAVSMLDGWIPTYVQSLV